MSVRNIGLPFFTTAKRSATKRNEAQIAISTLNRKQVFSKPVVTEIVAAPAFYPAEEGHQHYFAKHPEQGYCRFVIAPKVEAIRNYLG